MKNALIFGLVVTVRLALGQSVKLNLASDIWPPFTDVKDKHAFALDLVHEALARGSVDVNTEILEFKNVMEGINSKKFDGSAALWYSEERAKTLIFSKPYLENNLILVGKKRANVNAKRISDLKGKKLAVVESYVYGSLLDKTNGVTIIKGWDDQQNLERLLKGEVDYLLADALLIEYLQKFQGEEVTKYLEVGTTALATLPLHFAIRKDIPNAEKIMESFNLQISQMVAEGTYNKILQLDWIATDLDGDGVQEIVLSGDQAGTDAPMHSYSVKAVTNGSSQTPSHYMIEGKMYSNWEQVPEKYKVPQGQINKTDKVGFGPVLKF